MKNVTENSKEKTLDDYLGMLSYDYQCLADKLQMDYGFAKKKYYYTKQSIDNFFNNKSGKLNNTGANGRGREGLELHHFFENKYSNLTNRKKLSKYISEQNITLYEFENFQYRCNLIYVNPIEHIILHTLVPIRTEEDDAKPMRFANFNKAYKMFESNGDEIEINQNNQVNGPVWIKNHLSNKENVKKLASGILEKRKQLLNKQRKEYSEESKVNIGEIDKSIGEVDEEICKVNKWE